jgi:hypothetical protein
MAAVFVRVYRCEDGLEAAFGPSSGLGQLFHHSAGLGKQCRLCPVRGGNCDDLAAFFCLARGTVRGVGSDRPMTRF